MLTFKETADHYVVTQQIHSFFKTETTQIFYTKDLKSVRVDNDTEKVLSEPSRDWFRKYYSKHFNMEKGHERIAQKATGR